MSRASEVWAVARGSSSAPDIARALRDREEISISVTGRTGGRTITHTVWFVLDAKTLWLLPVRGSRTLWFQYLRTVPTITVRAGRRRLTAAAEPVTDPATVRAVVARFQRKYTREDIARYYTMLDVAVKVPIASSTRERGTRSAGAGREEKEKQRGPRK
jgi:hypothetical protein